jgi:hypothetical protein
MGGCTRTWVDVALCKTLTAHGRWRMCVWAYVALSKTLAARTHMRCVLVPWGPWGAAEYLRLPRVRHPRGVAAEHLRLFGVRRPCACRVRALPDVALCKTPTGNTVTRRTLSARRLCACRVRALPDVALCKTPTGNTVTRCTLSALVGLKAKRGYGWLEGQNGYGAERLRPVLVLAGGECLEPVVEVRLRACVLLAIALCKTRAANAHTRRHTFPRGHIGRRSAL